MAVYVVAIWGELSGGEVSRDGENSPGNCPHGGNVRGGTIRGKLSEGEFTGHKRDVGLERQEWIALTQKCLGNLPMSSYT